MEAEGGGQGQEGFPAAISLPEDPQFNVLELWTPPQCSPCGSMQVVWVRPISKMYTNAASRSSQCSSSRQFWCCRHGDGWSCSVGKVAVAAASVLPVAVLPVARALILITPVYRLLSNEGSMIMGGPEIGSYSLMNSNQPTSVSPRGRPTTGEPYRALMAHLEDYTQPLKVVLDRRAKSHYGMNRGFRKVYYSGEEAGGGVSG